MRALGVVLHHPPIECRLQLGEKKNKKSVKTPPASSSWPRRSTFPVVVGERGAVNTCRIPLSTARSRQLGLRRFKRMHR